MENDNAHYLSTDALDPIVDEVLDKMGICSAGMDRDGYVRG